MEIVGVLILAFFADIRVRAILALIILDLVLGVAAAMRLKEFDWKRVADFYQTNVIPFVLGYLGFYVATQLVAADLDILGEYSYLVGEVALSVAWAAILASLANDILVNIKRLDLGGIVKGVLYRLKM